MVARFVKKASPDALAPAERYINDVGSIPRLQLKVEILAFTLRFEGDVNDIKKSCNCINAAAQELMSSDRLKFVMDTVLAIGNVMNRGTDMEARAITLDSLLKLATTKAAQLKGKGREIRVKLNKDVIPVV